MHPHPEPLPPGRDGSGGGRTPLTPSPTEGYKCCKEQRLHSRDAFGLLHTRLEPKKQHQGCQEAPWGGVPPQGGDTQAGRQEPEHPLGLLCPTCPQPAALPEQPSEEGQGQQRVGMLQKVISKVVLQIQVSLRPLCPALALQHLGGCSAAAGTLRPGTMLPLDVWCCDDITTGAMKDQGHPAVVQPRTELPRG